MLRSHTGTKPKVKVIKHEEETGWEERLYSCFRCDAQIGRTCHSHYIFGHSTILQTNKFPRFCPKCGLMQNYDGLELPHAFFEEVAK